MGHIPRKEFKGESVSDLLSREGLCLEEGERVLLSQGGNVCQRVLLSSNINVDGAWSHRSAEPAGIYRSKDLVFYACSLHLLFLIVNFSLLFIMYFPKL